METVPQLCQRLLAVTIALACLAQLPGAFGQAKAEKVKPYPLKTCVVSGEKLGEMGAPYVFTNDGREIKLCCKGCLKSFKKEPAKYIKKIEEAEKAGEKGEKAGSANK